MIFYSKAFQPTNTRCPKCDVEMKVGKAIQYGPKGYGERVCTGFGRISLTYKDLTLIECLKCPKCGHSDDLE